MFPLALLPRASQSVSVENAYNFRELVRAVMKHRDPDAVVRSLAASQLLTQGLDRAQRFDEMLRLAQDPDQ